MARGGEGVRVEGLNKLVRDLQAVGLEVDDLKGAFSKIAAEAARVYAGYAPVKTGRLRADFRGNRAKSKAVVMAGRSSIPYAGPINYGWPKRNIAPADIGGKGDAAFSPRALQMLEDGINQAIRKRGLQ